MEEPLCTARHLNHIALVVRDIESALAFYRQVFGLPEAPIVDLEDQKVRACLVPVGGSQIEFIQPTDPGTGVARFLESRGEALHHIALEVEDLAGTLERLKSAGLRLVDERPREGLSGTIAFLHPSATRGVLIELVERREGPR